MDKARRLVVVVAGLLIGGAIGGPATGLSAQERPVSTLGSGDANIRGSVVDRITRAPVVGAEVLLRAIDRDGEAVLVTGERGDFHFASVPQGTYEMVIRRFGYNDLELDLDTGGGQLLEARIDLVPSALELEPIVVTSTSRDRLDWVGFRERSRTTQGQFLTRDDIQRRQVNAVSELFRDFSGFRIIPSSRGLGSTIVGRGNCQPAFYIDGILTQNLGSGQLDQMLEPDYLEGIEVYSGSQTPGQFQAGRCGTIVAWTHTPSQRTGHSFQWRRMGAAAALVVATFTLAF